FVLILVPICFPSLHLFVLFVQDSSGADCERIGPPAFCHREQWVSPFAAASVSSTLVRLGFEQFSFVLRTSWARAGSTIPQAPEERRGCGNTVEQTGQRLECRRSGIPS